jgi:serine/threonine-protein kinase
MQVGKQVGPFVIEKVLGSGAMGTVYRGRYTKTGARVALKVIAPGLTENATLRARFEREAAILKQLQHPNIVRYYGAGRSQGTPYYAMEYVEGESLDHVLARRGRMTWEELVQVGEQLCAALQHAHEHGIIHRDLKPSNLMVLRDGTVKLTDFGIAKDLDVTGLTSAHCTVGTASYMSPEQCRGERDLTHKSDLYSLGIMFYELLTGRKPFQAETPMEMFMQHIQGTFERPSRLVLDTPVWLDNLICQLLEKKPEQRPRDAEMVAKALGQVAEKVAAQKSAGVEAVKTRAIDRPRGAAPVDDTDREAARTLREVVTGKKRKRKHRPFYTRVWFQAVAILLLLAGMAGLLYLVFRPPSADAQFAHLQALLTSSDPDKWDAAAPEIDQFLRRHPRDPRAETVRVWSTWYDIYATEPPLYNRIEGKIRNEPDDEAETLAFAAIRAEKAGDLEQAKGKWQELIDLPQASHALRMVATHHVAEMVRIQAAGEKMQQNLDRYRDGQDKPGREEDRLALEVMRYEVFGDLPAALSRWRELREKDAQGRPPRRPPPPALEQSPELRQEFYRKLGMWGWDVFAASRIRELEKKKPDKPEEARKKLLESKLKEARDDIEQNRAAEGFRICQELVHLYEGGPYPGVDKFVSEARHLLPDSMQPPLPSRTR